MHFAPLPHGSSGWFDEIILVAEAALVVALAIMYIRSRGHKPVPPGESPVESSNPPVNTERH
jgi:hypothetical protein